MNAKQHAVECLKLAQEATTDGARRALIRMALAFRLEHKTGLPHCCCCMKPHKAHQDSH